MMIAAQDFQNLYEKFYAKMRNYLWPYKVLSTLADIEVEIYSAFVDIEKLSADLGKLRPALREVAEDDEKLMKAFDDIVELTQSEIDGQYSRLYKVEEVDPEKNKNIRTLPIEEEEENEDY